MAHINLDMDVPRTLVTAQQSAGSAARPTRSGAPNQRVSQQIRRLEEQTGENLVPQERTRPGADGSRRMWCSPMPGGSSSSTTRP